MTPLEAAEASIMRAKRVGQARHDELFRCVDIIECRAVVEQRPEVAVALLEAAMAMLK